MDNQQSDDYLNQKQEKWRKKVWDFMITPEGCVYKIILTIITATMSIVIPLYWNRLSNTRDSQQQPNVNVPEKLVISTNHDAIKKDSNVKNESVEINQKLNRRNITKPQPRSNPQSNIKALENQVRDAEDWDGLAFVTVEYKDGEYDPKSDNWYVARFIINRTFKISYVDVKEDMKHRLFGRDKVSVSVIHDGEGYNYSDWVKDVPFPLQKEYRFMYNYDSGKWILQ
jgi:hypothetical protein